MKWMFVGLVLATVFIGAGLLLSDRSNTDPYSHNEKAVKLALTGSQQVQAFQFKEAAKNLETALEIDPSLAEAAIDLATAFFGQGHREEYKAALARADSLTGLIENDNRRMVAQMRLGMNHRSRFSGMVDSLMTRLEENQPNNIYVMTAVAERYGAKLQAEKEYQAWEKILEKNPNFAEAYNRLGYFELNRGHYRQAIEHMKKYAFLAPGLANPHDSLGDVLMVMGEYEEAAKEFRASIAAQPDFFFSYINLGKSYLYRGMIKSGLEIMDQVHTMVSGTNLGSVVEKRLLRIFLDLDMMPEVHEMTKTFVEHYPKDDLANYFKAIHLAGLGKWQQSAAVRDSSFNYWRSQKVYQDNKNVRAVVDLYEKRFEAYVADLKDQPSTRVRKWQTLVTAIADLVPLHDQRDSRIKLAVAYLDNGEPEKALEQLRPILEVNNRLVPALIAAVKTDIALKDAPQARMALEQLKWSIQQSDDDYVGRAQAAKLEELVLDLEGHS